MPCPRRPCLALMVPRKAPCDRLNIWLRGLLHLHFIAVCLSIHRKHGSIDKIIRSRAVPQELLHGAVLRGHERGRDVRGAVLAEELRRDLHKHTQGRTVVSHDGEARFPQVGIKARIQMES